MGYKNKTKLIKSAGLVLMITGMILLIFEMALVQVFGYDEYFKGESNFKIQRSAGRYSEYNKNVSVIQKHWENDIEVEYSFNKFGRRDDPDLSHITEDTPCLALVGDSFTLGSMLPIEDVFHTVAVRNFHKSKFCVHNYGVGGEQLEQVFDRLNSLEAVAYQKIIYAMTPNDLFDVVGGSISNNNNIRPQKVNTEFERKHWLDIIKAWVLKRAITRFLLHTALSNDVTYFNLYMRRQPYSEYLAKELTPRYAYALSVLAEKIEALPTNVREKFQIFLIPQRAEVVQRRLSTEPGHFNSELLDLCLNLDVPCGTVDLDELRTIESHFPVDGHLTSAGSVVVAKSFSLFLSRTASEPSKNHGVK